MWRNDTNLNGFQVGPTPVKRMDPSLPQYTHHEEGYGKNAAEQRAFAATALPVLKEALGNSIYFRIISSASK